MRTAGAILWGVLLVCPALAGPEWAVVRIPSHGGSGVVIATGPGQTWILTAAHMFDSKHRTKRIQVDAPSPRGGGPPQPGGATLARLGNWSGGSAGRDLALILLRAGPLPYVAPVAPAGRPTPRQCLSVGYDGLRLPAIVRPVRVLQAGNEETFTAERPKGGRSGGGLLDPTSGHLYGIVTGFTGPDNGAEVHPRGQGIHASHRAVLAFLRPPTSTTDWETPCVHSLRWPWP